ncbi:alpha/beta hydrolase family protein [Terrarubrum flagellatum]|uniref:alpha/beta hydrolase family protein n=1 Tax=Terrirubrum flagellatum TaxID=2895980 RepID=UPI0031451EC5
MTIIERTHYFAKPGAAADVLATRRRACAVRLSLGLSPGEIFVKGQSGDGSEADVTWQCAFPDADAQARDLAARGASVDFEAVRATMRGLISRFERHVFESVDLALPSRLRDTPISGHTIAPRQISFSSGGYALKGWLHLPPGEGPFPLVITNHGSGIDKGTEDTSRPGTALLLMSWGIASFLPHRRGYGASEGPGWREEVSAPYGTDEYDAQLAARLDRESDDVLRALDVVAALPEIDAKHIGVMGSSFGGTTTLLAASKSEKFTCAVEFAGAAMNWDRTPGLRKLMIEAAHRVTAPIFFIQAENDYSIRPTKELAQSLEGSGKVFQSRIYPQFGVNAHEGHLLESRGPSVWAADVRLFLERYL